MSTDVDWQRELDGSFGAGHDLPPAHYVAAGRSAVRRRRAVSIAIVASMAVGVGAAWASGPGGAPRGDAPLATQPPVPTETQEDGGREDRAERLRDLRDATSQLDEPFFASGPATLDEDGLVLAPGAGPVLERVRNPMGYTPAQGQSLAIRVMFEGGETYSLLVRHADGGTSMGSNPATGDFAGWLAGRVASQRYLDVENRALEEQPTRLPGDPSDWLELGPDGEVVRTDDVVLLQQDASPDLGEGFAPRGTRVGAVRVLVDERPYYAVYRVVDGELDVIAPLSAFESMSAFIDWARQQYASGAGMR